MKIKIIFATLALFCSYSAFSQWSQKGADINGAGAYDYSGNSVDMSSDGNTVVTAADGVQIYEWNGSAWVQKGATIGSTTLTSVSISADGNTVVIGDDRHDGNSWDSGETEVYTWTGSAWVQKGASLYGVQYDYSGESVSISADGNRIAVGGPQIAGTGTQRGITRVYHWNGSSWSQTTTITGEADYDRSGHDVALSLDGNTLAIGASLNDGNGSSAGHVRLYKWNGSSWAKAGADIDGQAWGQQLGASVGLSLDGNTVAVGSISGTGFVRIYAWSGAAWVQQGADINGEASVDQSGFSVSTSDDGTRVIIGAIKNAGNGTRSGHCRVYKWDGAAWVQEGNDINGEAAYDESGFSVSMSANGQSVSIGAKFNDGAGSASGHVRVYCLASTFIDVINDCNSHTWIDGITYTTDNNTAVHIIPNATGCDSIITLDLTLNFTTGIDVVDTCAPYTWMDGNVYTLTNFTATDTLVNALGCDSIVTLNLTVLNNTGIDVITACDTYTWTDGITYTSSNFAATDTFTNVAGCDSVVTLNLTINYSNSGIQNTTACNSYTWSATTTTYTTSGTHTANLTNIYGCDSLATLNLTVNYGTTGTETVVACDNYTWPANAAAYIVSGSYVAVLTNSVGCDSTVTLNLTIKYGNTGSENSTACDTYTWPTNNATYTTSGAYVATLTNVAGCDSIVTLNLTINYSNSGSESITACDIYTWSANTTTYTSSGTYLATLTNVAGCDSVATLNLTINYSTSSSINPIVCNTYSSPVGNTYTTSGTYIEVLTNAAGCDSTITIDLTVNYSSAGAESATSCDSYLWSTNSTTYSSSGTYNTTLTNAVGCDSTATLNLTINNSTTGSEAATACDSYTWPANTTTYNASGTYTTVLTNAVGCDSTLTLNLTIFNSNSSTENVTACASYTWSANTTAYTVTGTYVATLTNVHGCDSVVTLNLTINNPNSGAESITSCGSYTWAANSTTYLASGTYTATLTNAAGCDSLASLNLAINNSTTGSETATACGSYTWAANSSTYTSSGVYTTVLTNGAGCDSTVTLNLTLNNSNGGTSAVTTCTFYTWPANATTYSASGTYITTLTNVAGCDSVATLNLTISNTTNGSQSITACNSYTWSANTTTYTTSGTYTAMLTNVVGCDSTATLNLTVNNSSSNTINPIACDSYLSPNGNTYTSTGTYTDVISNGVGCDSTITINLTVNSSSGSAETISACDSYLWPSNGSTYTSSGSYTHTLTNAAGCDSLLILNLTINNSTPGSESVVACGSYFWSTNSTNYTSSGAYTEVLANAQGCDSVVTLNLTINNSNSGTSTITACGNYTWSANTVTYSASGTYVATLTNIAACDSTATLNLTITNSTTGSESITACNSYTWSANATTYTTSGAYTATLTNGAGCDSTATLNLTVNSSSSSTINPVACDSYVAPDGNTYTSTGTYAAIITNAVGCDSTITINLTVNSSSGSAATITACDSYLWPTNSSTYTLSGAYTSIFTNAAGCDSTVTLNLTINSSNAGSETVTACDNYTWPANSTTYTSSGTFSATLTNASGCDSVATLNLTINNSNAGSETVTACDNYTWVANSTTYTSSGTFSATLTNASGCDSVATLNLTINTVTNTITQSGAALTADAAGAGYQWVNCPAMTPIAGATAINYTATVNGDYAVIVTQNGCTDTSACVTVTGIGILENAFANELIVFPNPTLGKFSIDLNSVHEEITLTVTDICGKLISTNTYNQSQLIHVEIEEAPGIYLLIVESGENKALLRLIKN
jgi:hypothetical protein